MLFNRWDSGKKQTGRRSIVGVPLTKYDDHELFFWSRECHRRYLVALWLSTERGGKIFDRYDGSYYTTFDNPNIKQVCRHPRIESLVVQLFSTSFCNSHHLFPNFVLPLRCVQWFNYVWNQCWFGFFSNWFLHYSLFWLWHLSDC